MPIDPLSILAEVLAAHLFEVGRAHLNARLGGGPQQRALRRVYERGIAAMLGRCASHLGEGRREQFGAALRNLIDSQVVAEELLDLALSSPASLDNVRAALASPTFALHGVRADDAIAALVAGLDDALTQEAAQPDSPLTKQVLVMRQRLAQRRQAEMLSLLQKITERLVQEQPGVSLPRPSVFISYARSDGREFAALLFANLRGLGFNVWRDVMSLTGGR